MQSDSQPVEDPTSRSAGAKGNQTGSKAKLDPVGLVLNRRLSPTGGHKIKILPFRTGYTVIFFTIP